MNQSPYHYSGNNPIKFVYFDDLVVTVNEHPVIQTASYFPFGMQHAGGYQRVTAKENRFLFNGKERMNDLDLGWDDFGWRMYDPTIARWNHIDPLAEKMRRWSPYAYAFNNPIRFIDPDGMIPWPVNEKFNNFTRRVASWFGPRNVTGNAKATKNHKGLDINFGGGYDDYGAPVLATHDGKVHEIQDNTSGNGGRRVVIQAADGSFQTLYYHLKSINVKAGDEVKEGQQIGTIGASAFGSEKGTASHLHYGIKKQDENGVLQWFNPTQGKGNSESNIVDPQSWITSDSDCDESGVTTSTTTVKDEDGNKVGTATKYENNGKNETGWSNFVTDLLNALSNPSNYTGAGGN